MVTVKQQTNDSLFTSFSKFSMIKYQQFIGISQYSSALDRHDFCRGMHQIECDMKWVITENLDLLKLAPL